MPRHKKKAAKKYFLLSKQAKQNSKSKTKNITKIEK